VPIAQPGELLELLPERGGLAWVTGGEGLVGWGTAARLDLTGPDPFGRAEAWWQELTAGVDVVDEVGLPGCGPVAFGSFAFDAETGSSALVVPETVVGVHDGVWWLTTVGRSPGLPERRDRPAAPGPLTGRDGARTAADWTGLVAAAVGRIASGEVAKVVLARDVVVEAGRPVDPRWPLRRLAGQYPSCWTFAVDGLLGATPEMLVRLEKGVATSRVLAGTLRRNGDPARDRYDGTALAGSIKDLEEHGYGVRSVADALARHCRSVEVPEVLRAYLGRDVL